MKSINLNTLSNTLESKHARALATAAFKWFVKGHTNDLNDYDFIKGTVLDYLDLVKIAQQIDLLDAYVANDRNAAGQGMMKRKIARMMWDLDTIVRDQIPETVYARFHFNSD